MFGRKERMGRRKERMEGRKGRKKKKQKKPIEHDFAPVRVKPDTHVPDFATASGNFETVPPTIREARVSLRERTKATHMAGGALFIQSSVCFCILSPLSVPRPAVMKNL